MDAVQTLIDKLTKEREQYEGLKVGTEDWKLAAPFMAALETRLAEQEKLKAQLQGESLASRCPSASSLATHAWSASDL
jgi:hypothetical protein